MPGPACVPRANFGTPLTRIVALAPQGAPPRAHRRPISAHPSRGSWPWPHAEPLWPCPDPIRSFSEGPSGRARMCPQGKFRHTPHEDRGPGPIGSSTEGPFWRTPHEDRCPDPFTKLFRRSQWQGPCASSSQFSAHPSRGSWPSLHRELHRGPTDAPFRHTSHEDRGLGRMRSSSRGPSGRARVRPQAQFRHTPHEDRGPGPIGGSTGGPSKVPFGAPLTRIVAP